MLWFKGWLETRLRALFAMGICLLIIVLDRHATPTPAVAQRLASTFAFFWAFIPSACGLAGAGVRTQPAFQAIKGAHGSMYFTLSLPVRRMRLLAIRAALGWIETAAVIALACLAAWTIVPALRANVAISVAGSYVVTVAGCVSLFYFLSVFFATFLDAQWLPFAGVLCVGGLAFALPKVSALPFLNVFQVMGASSPLFGQAIPWASIAASLAAGLLFLMAAGFLLQRREY